MFEVEDGRLETLGKLRTLVRGFCTFKLNWFCSGEVCGIEVVVETDSWDCCQLDANKHLKRVQRLRGELGQPHRHVAEYPKACRSASGYWIPRTFVVVTFLWSEELQVLEIQKIVFARVQTESALNLTWVGLMRYAAGRDGAKVQRNWSCPRC